jgi:hypothetical protein
MPEQDDLAQELTRAQDIINSLRGHWQATTDALVLAEAENARLKRQIKALTDDTAKEDKG